MKKETKKLHSGYTTGAHASFAFHSALDLFLATNKHTLSKTNKMDNDDLDVTKGCEIIVSISNNLSDLKLNSITHKPYILESKNSKCFVYAGEGVGVVTKDGLKPPKGYPAINPTPLESFRDIFLKTVSKKIEFFCCVSVSDGEVLALQTANAKVGVLGGISILGTRGIVKPISADAYLDSIKEELNFAYTNAYESIHFTLGNSSYQKALKSASEVSSSPNSAYIIEIGNFIFDGISLAVSKKFKNIVLWIGVAKSVKIAQGCKNTHNRFGSIDFKDVGSWIDKDLEDCITIKGLRESLGDDVYEFDKIVLKKTKEQLYRWFDKKIEVIIC
ncbi:MAG: cobalt-precorrin-5B (C(1))-methyltransferase [Campylobacterota bacterium]|nr:cobalt-precorrin-5B (C(1))-methyltransferase [Campylobacterota bacterium]